VTVALKKLTLRCYPKTMSRLTPSTRFIAFAFFILFISACGVVTPPPVPTPPPLCNEGQISTEAEPCTARPTPDPNNPNNPSNPSNPGTTPKACQNSPTTVRSTKALCSITTFKASYAPGASDTIYMSVKLRDATVTFVKPTFVFDIVRVNVDKSTTSVAGPLLNNKAPSANPDIFQGDLTREQLLTGLETSIAFEFSAKAAVGKYVMVISLFSNTDAKDPANLVGRVFYNFEITANP
jgi:hypothetical protein